MNDPAAFGLNARPAQVPAVIPAQPPQARAQTIPAQSYRQTTQQPIDIVAESIPALPNNQRRIGYDGATRQTATQTTRQIGAEGINAQRRIPYIQPKLREETNPVWQAFNQREKARTDKLNAVLSNERFAASFNSLSQAERDAIANGNASKETLTKWFNNAKQTPAQTPKTQAQIQTAQLPKRWQRSIDEAIARNATINKADGRYAKEAGEILQKLKAGKAWIYDHDAKAFKEINALTFEYDGYHFAIAKANGKGSHYDIYELTTGAKAVPYTQESKNIDALLRENIERYHFLAEANKKRGIDYQRAIDERLKDYPRSPFKPEAKATEALAQEAKATEATPKPQETIAQPAPLPPPTIAEAEAKVANTERLIREGDYETTRTDLKNARKELDEAKARAQEATPIAEATQTATATATRETSQSIDGVLASIEREITPETPPFIRSEYGRLTQAIKTGDREAVQAIATEAAENPRLQSVYDRAYEALAVMKEQPVAQASKRASQTKQIAITESDVKRQVADYMAKNKRTPAATNTPAPTTQTPIANTTATHTTATTAPADPQMPAIKPENYKAIVKKATADIEAAQERFNKEWEAATAAKDKYKIDWIKKQIGAIPAAKRILPKLKMGEAWVNDVIKGTGRHKVNALLFELDGFKLALYRSPVKYGGTAARNNWGVLETKSGGGFGAPTEASASDALISAMAMYETVGRKNGVKRAVDSWIANYGKANPNAPTTRQTAKPQTPATAAKTADRKSDFINSQKTEPTPTATETTATSKASAEIEQALAQTQQIIDDRIAKMQRRLAKEKVSLKESVIFSERYDSAMGEVNGLERQIANYRKYSKVIPQLKLNPDKAWAWDVKTNKYIAVEGSSFDYAGNRYIAHRTFREKGPNTAKFEVTEVTSGDYTGGGANAVTAITSALGHIDRAIADGFPINYLSSIKDHGRSPYVFASPHASGAAIGSTAGFERDENGNLRYNAAKGLAGALGGFAIASKLNNRFNKPQAFATQKTQNLGRNANSVAQNTIKQQGASVNSIFGGENAANAPLTPLQEAKRLARRGASDKAIHAKTGWFKDRDGKWKFEIDDSKWKLDASVVDKLKQPNHENIYLGDLLKHDELFKQYPTLRKKVVFAARKDLGVDGLYTGNLIIYPLNRPEVLIHEIQHAVQDIEGFARGGSEYLDFDYYRNLHGEAEARNAQWRRGLTAAERAKSYPPSTFDVDPKKTFVLDENGNSIAASEAKAIEPLDTEAVKRLSQGNDKIYISELNADETKEIVEAFKRQYGEDVAFKVPQITRTINGDQIRHTLKNHGDPKTEAARGNIAVTLEDIAKYPEIVKDHTRKIYSHTKGGKPAIVYGKQEKGYTIIVEEIRTGRGDIAFFDMYKHKGTLTEDSLKLAKDKANDGKGRLPTLFHGVRERSATPAQAESVAQAATKSQGVKAQSPVHVGSSAAGFVIGGSSGENGWSNERALLGAAGGFALASRFGKRDLRKTYDNAVKSRQAFDDITGSLGSLKRTWKNTLSEGYEAIREARNVKLNVEANKLERLHKAIATEFNEAERKALHEYVAGETQTIAPHIKPLADHVKKTIDDLSKDLVNDGILSKEAYQEWAGKYIHRSYEKHLGLKGAITNIKQIPDYLRGRMGESKSIAPIIARGKIWRGGKKEYQGYVNSGQIGKVSDGKIEAIQDLASGKYTFRRDWTKTEREAMGEITDAAYSIPETLLRLQTMKQNGAFLRDVEGVKGAVLDESAGRIANDKLKGSGYDRVPNNAKYGVLADRAVRADVSFDLRFTDRLSHLWR